MMIVKMGNARKRKELIAYRKIDSNLLEIVLIKILAVMFVNIRDVGGVKMLKCSFCVSERARQTFSKPLFSSGEPRNVKLSFYVDGSIRYVLDDSSDCVKPVNVALILREI